jgi:hypothetical protein
MSLHRLAEQGFVADALQRPLRFRFQARLQPGVSHLADTSTYGNLPSFLESKTMALG